MKRLLLVFVTLVFTSCSLDNKTGIWKDASEIHVDRQNSESITNNQTNTRYENINTKNKIFNEEKESTNLSDIKIGEPIKIANWFEQFAIPTNNISNFSYNNNKTLLSKSTKLNKLSSSKNSFNKKIVFNQSNLISYDHKGTIFVYSLSSNKKILEYNFYNKKFKKFNKEINFIVSKNVLYISDNLGYLYALNLDNNSIIWAKNYGIPFRSNIKLTNNQIFLANQDNVIYSINSKTGTKNWQFATGLTFLKSDFENNFALDLINNNLLFLNTSGELYSIDFVTQKVNWVLNFKNPSLDADTELFLSQPIIIKDNNFIITTEKTILSYNSLTGARNWRLSSEPIFKPIITKNFVYALLKNNLLICLDNISGDVIWSKNILKDIDKKKVINKFRSVADFKIINSKINIYSKNGYLLSFNPNDGKLNSLSKVSKNGINSEIFFLNDNMLFLGNNNKMYKFD